MSPDPDVGAADWDVVLRPRTTPRYAYGAAALTLAVGIAIALTLRIRSTGPTLRVADQFAMAGLAVILAGSVLLLTLPRLKVGPAGLAVRNMLGYRVIPWEEVVDVSFPRGRRWARVDLAHNEYFPVLAIQSNDRDRAVAAMDTVRELMARYRPRDD
jgi:hypothetical protein